MNAIPGILSTLHSDMGWFGWLSASVVGVVLAITLAVVSK